MLDPCATPRLPGPQVPKQLEYWSHALHAAVHLGNTAAKMGFFKHREDPQELTNSLQFTRFTTKNGD